MGAGGQGWRGARTTRGDGGASGPRGGWSAVEAEWHVEGAGGEGCEAEGRHKGGVGCAGELGGAKLSRPLQKDVRTITDHAGAAPAGGGAARVRGTEARRAMRAEQSEAGRRAA
eukprot:4849535-Prymnesium_polylepis.1